ncbi:hypothetical protein ACQPWY_17590 [Pseudonocardia xinjiangensis]|uniref:hypothetical protein n=1 Tax=Pseudonocardia xinjiangensis TaxID=75289 RepID=UPI003D8E301A
MLTVRGAELVWTGETERPGGELACDRDGLVSAAPVDGDVLDASGCVVTPGLVNAHHHLLQSAFRTLPGTRGVPMREWLPRMASTPSSRTARRPWGGRVAAVRGDHGGRPPPHLAGVDR